MTDSTWATGTPPPFGLTFGFYASAANWSPAAVPDGTATFSFTFMTTVYITSAVSVGAWSITYAPYIFLSSSTLNFTGAGVSGGTGSVLSNSGTVNFLNASSAGNLVYGITGTMNFVDSSTAGNALITVGKTGALNFTEGATAGNAALTTEADGGQFGRVTFSGDGPAHDHKLTAGSFAGAGIFDLGANQVTVGNATDTIVSGQIIGSSQARLLKVGVGTMTLNGVNTVGAEILDGELIVNGQLGDVIVGRTANFDNRYGLFAGSGTVGKLTAKYGQVSAGDDTFSVGLLATAGLDLRNFSSFNVDIEGTSAPGPGGYDQVSVTGKVKLSGGSIQVGMSPVYDPSRPSFLVIDNDGSDKVSGHFGNGLYGPLAEGDTFTGNNQVYSVTYKGGTGNDVGLRGEGPVSIGTDTCDTINLTTAPLHKATNYADYIDGAGGDDTVDAGGGNDTVDGGEGKNKLNGGGGTRDFVTFAFADDGHLQVTLNGSKWATIKLDGQAHGKIRNFENLGGGYQADRLTGDGKNNILKGNDGNDTIKGGDGNDVLVGEDDKDRLEGGAGRDKFVFTQQAAPKDADKVSDFRHGEDKLLLYASAFDTIGKQLDASEFYANAGATKAHDHNDRIIYNTSTGKLYLDDGKGGDPPVLFATLTNHAGLTASDFVVIV